MTELTTHPVQQPTKNACVHACLSMVTGVDVGELLGRFGDRGLSWEEEATVLVEHALFPREQPPTSLRPFSEVGLYLVTVPSRNEMAKSHKVVVEVTEDDFAVFDPQYGQQNMKAYTTHDLRTGQMPCIRVTYIDPWVLRKMRNRNQTGTTGQDDTAEECGAQGQQ